LPVLAAAVVAAAAKLAEFLGDNPLEAAGRMRADRVLDDMQP